MKKNGKGSFLAVLWWVIACLCLGVLLLLLAPREERISDKENRMLAGIPVLTAETLRSGEFFSGIEDFLSDGFFARDSVIGAADAVLGMFDRRTDEQRQMQEEARTNALLTADAADGAPEDDGISQSAPTAAPAVSPAPIPTAAPAAVPTVIPTSAPTAVPTQAPAEEPTPVEAATVSPAPTPVPTSTPVPTPTPRITAAPRVIEPLPADAVYELELLKTNGDIIHQYEYPAENIMSFARSLNHLKSLLPEDGEVHYMQPPVAAVGRRLRNSQYSGWRSSMEEALQSQVETGVEIYNIPAILNDALIGGQECYYYDDHHWTPLAAWYAVDAVMQRRGYPTIPYDAYEYEDRFMGKDDAKREDWLHLLYPLAPTHSYILTKLTESIELDFMNYRSSTYSAYINNTRTPWRRFTTGYASERRALLISDSFGNVFLPYLLPYYGEVHMTDLRASYYDVREAGGTFTELVQYHEIDDIYVVLSTSNGINSANSLKVFYNAITK